MKNNWVATAAVTTLATAVLGAGCGASDQEPTGESLARPVVWVANEGGDSVTVLDAATGRTLATLTGVDDPHNVQASASGDRVWVTGAGGVIEVGAESLAVRHVAPAGDHPAHVVAAPDGVLVTSYGDGVLHDLTEDLVPRAAHELGGGPHGMRVAPDGSFVAVANLRGGTLDLVDLPLAHDAEGAPGGTRSVEVGPGPVQVAIGPDSETVFVSVSGTRRVVRVDVASGRVTGSTRVTAAPAQLWVTGTGHVLSADQGTEDAPGSTLSVIDADTMRTVARIPTGQGPHGVVATEDDGSAWVTNTFDDTVTLVDLEALAAVATYPVGDRPNGITLGRAALDGTGSTTTLLMPAPYAPADHEHGEHEHGADEHGADEHGADEHGADEHGADEHGTEEHSDGHH